MVTDLENICLGTDNPRILRLQIAHTYFPNEMRQFWRATVLPQEPEKVVYNVYKSYIHRSQF